jgi:putative endonuclease
MNHNYFVYIITNPKKSVLYTGVTNDLANRLQEHFANKGNKSTFAGRYFCFNLLYFEQFDRVEHAIAREKEIKGWTREKKENLISKTNAEWRFLNRDVKDL